MTPAEKSSAALFIKFLRFFSTLGSSTWGRFAQIYYNDKGLTPANIGTIEAVMPLVAVLTQPVWGFVADRLQSKKRVFCVLKTINTALLLLFAVPAVATGFLPILLISTALACFVAPGLIEAYTLDVCAVTGTSYGEVRLYGAISWGLGAFVMGILNDRYGFEINFLLYGIFSVITLSIVAWKFPARDIPQPPPMGCIEGVVDPTEHADDDDKAPSEVAKSQHAVSGVGVHAPMSLVLRDLRGTLMTWDFFIFLAETVIAGMGIGVVERLLFVYLMNDLSANTSLCGAIVLITVVFEIPIFHYAEIILRRCGVNGSLLISYLCYCTRVYGYTLLTHDSLHWIFALEAMHGVTFALLWTTIVHRSSSLGSAEWRGTVQSIVNIAYGGLGNGGGALIGGIVMVHYGAKVMYSGAAAIIFGLFCIRAALGLVNYISTMVTTQGQDYYEELASE